MGHHYSAEPQWVVINFKMYKLLVALVLVALAFAEPEAEADADAAVVYYGHHYPAFYKGYPSWPGVRGLGFESTCFGCRPVYGRKKREAEPTADADARYGYYYRGYYGYPYYGYHGLYHGLHGSGIAGHPGGATSFVSRSVQGAGRKRREAEADADADAYYGYYGHGYGHRIGGYYGHHGYGHRYGHGYYGHGYRGYYYG